MFTFFHTLVGCIVLLQSIPSVTAVNYFHNINLASYTTADVSFLEGHTNRGNFGDSVQAIGDFNGDGYGDFIIGAYWESSQGRAYNGNIYVFYGSAHLAVNISTPAFIIYGEASNYFTGISVSGAGDVNGDGLNDLIVSSEIAMAQNAIVNGGTSYVIFGTRAAPSNIDLLTMPNTQGFRIWGANQFDYSGSSVAAAGDVNKDGYADVIVGAFNATNPGYANTGAAYVIFGKASGFTNIDLLLLTPSQGFAIYGAEAGEAAGYAVSGADVNGDGYSDLIIGSYYYNGYTGKVYVLFGTAGNRQSVQLRNMKLGTDGFVIEAANSGDGLGAAVAGLFDVNDDKIPDLIVSSHWATWDYRAHCGVAYVLFGSKSFQGTINLGSITSTNGFLVIGAGLNYNTGSAVSSAGDVNGDGIGDFIVGSSQATVNGNANAGISHVIFGSPVSNNIDLLRFPSSRGFEIEGADANDNSGISVGGGADFNGDGLDDLVVGATGASVGSIAGAGKAYIVLGMTNPPPTSAPSPAPTPTPTPAPTSTPTLPIVKSELYIRLVNVSTNAFSVKAQNAIIATINQILTTGITVTYEDIPDYLQYGPERWSVVVDLHLIEPMGNFISQYGSNETKFISGMENALRTAITNGQFTTILRTKAQLYSATEITSVSVATMAEFNSYTIIPGSTPVGADESNENDILGLPHTTFIIIICCAGGGFILLSYLTIRFFCQRNQMKKTETGGSDKAGGEGSASELESNISMNEIVAVSNEENVFAYKEEQEKDLQRFSYRHSRKDLEIGDEL